MAKILPLSFSLLFFIASASPQHHFLESGEATHRGPDAGLFPDTPHRKKIDLSGPWQYSFGEDAWGTVAVPSAYDFIGKVVFQRMLQLDSEILDHYVFSLVAYGINYQSEITINGTFIGRHVGGYSSFVMPIGEDILQVGSENVLTIAVDNELDARATLPPKQRVGGWRSYGGIARDIYLLATPRLFISDVDVKSELSADYRTAKLRVRATIENRNYQSDKLAASKGEYFGYAVELYDKLSGDLVSRVVPVPFKVGENMSKVLSVEFPVSSPKLWSPATPDLYVLKCYIVHVVGKTATPFDEYDLNMGIHDLKLEEQAVILNGQPLMIRGVVWREDHSAFGSAMTHEAMEKDVAQIKGLGANLIRFLHPPHPYMLNLCDRYGLLVMEEIPLVGVPAEIVTDEQYQELITGCVKEMIGRDRGHVSVLAWGLGDALDFEWSNGHACEVVTAMRGLVSSLDGRQTYYATAVVNDPCLDRFSLLAVNTYTKQQKEFRQILAQWKDRYPSKVLLVARYGKDVEPQNRNGYSDPLSVESQARYAMQHFEVVKDLKLAGAVWWSYSDWRGDRPALSTHSGDPYVHAMGLFSYDREKRPAYDVLRATFNGEKVAALPIGNYSSSAPVVYVLSGLVVLITFAFLYNSNRRFRENVNRALTRTYNFFADVRDQRILSYAHSMFLAAVIAVTWATVLSSILAHYRDDLLLDNLLSQFIPDAIKAWLVLLIWNPTRFILAISGVILIQFVLLSLLVQLFSFLARARVSLYHSVSVAVWSMLPYVVLIPLAMILYRIMETPVYIVPSFVLISVLVIWTTYRLLKGVSVIFDVYPVKVYVVGLLLIVGSVAFAYGYLDYTQEASFYLKHLIGLQSSAAM